MADSVPSDDPLSGDETAGDDAEAAADDAGSTRSRLRALGVALGLGLAGPLLGVVLFFVLVSALRFAGVSLSLLVAVSLLLLVTQWGGFGGTTALFLRHRGESLADLGVRRVSPREFLLVLGGVVGAFVLSILGTLVLSAVSVEGAPNQATELGQQDPTVFLLLIVGAFLVIGPCEELLFRGVVQRRLREDFGPVVAIGVAAALFAAIHFFALNGPSLARLASVSVLLFPSLVLGATYEYTGNLTVPILIHAIYDAIIFGLLYVAVVYAPA